MPTDPLRSVELEGAAIMRKVRELEIKSKKITTHLFTGEYHSAFKGKGMSFREVREYYAGDDVRFIDWNVSARFSHPFTKVFEEERELCVYLLVDTSASNLFGTVQSRKRDIITEIGALLTFSAINNNDKVGVIFFSDKVEIFKEKPQMHDGWINGGFFIIELKFFDFIDGDHILLEREPLEKATKLGQLMAYQHKGFWHCMDTKRDHDLLESLWKNGAPWKT